MLSKNQIKFVNSLKVNKYRKLHGQFITEGPKLAQELIEGRLEVKSVFCTNTWLQENLSLLEQKNILFTEITERELKKISALTTPNQVLLTIATPLLKIEAFILPDDITLVLDGISDPGNLGTIIRLADWFGIKNIVCSGDCVDAYNPKTVQASMGSIARVHVYYANLVDFLKQKPPDAHVYGTFLEGEPLHSAKLNKKSLLVIGSESHGISEEIMPFITQKLLIPSQNNMEEHAESLNASVAAAICCYEFRRQLV